MERRYREGMPPHIGFGKRADGDTSEAASPLVMHVRSELVTGEPIDLVFLNAVEDHLITERDAVGWTGVGAFTANLAKVIDADVHRLVGNQRQVGKDRVGHVNTSAEIFIDDQA